MLSRSSLIVILVIGALIAGCAGQPGNNPTGGIALTQVPPAGETSAPSATLTVEAITPQATLSGGATVTSVSCQLTPIVAPTMAPNPGYTALDQTTGLHVTGDPKIIDPATFRLKVTGLVDHPLSLSYDDLRCMPKVTASPTLVCPGFFEDNATWSGVPIKYVLGLAGVKSGATGISMLAADGYETRLDLKDALADGNFLAYEWNGQPLPVLHGFPVRAVFSALQGNTWVKWLLEIRLD